MFFDVIAKYTDERNERLMAYIGTESTRLLEIQHELIDNPKLCLLYTSDAADEP